MDCLLLLRLVAVVVDGTEKVRSVGYLRRSVCGGSSWVDGGPPVGSFYLSS